MELLIFIIIHVRAFMKKSDDRRLLISKSFYIQNLIAHDISCFIMGCNTKDIDNLQILMN